eukprot:CAMPEP_0117039988 /NCGR_PEP_ID=MMETSP0472-20121206/28021_1 /TAXON_ID=693140 ORGANISM="Tiarina fusus, Strain LIS" /NCGR_SAMPLE_ID=MMETSP0472 /ASSEMBLY_ACC=CAM_ASM_000603 /LENGTH=301 /DNA_ID=CAMNT_0004750613 /DNA_START=90 /DNA_END=995 /DNA_ORIENTATION=-
MIFPQVQSYHDVGVGIGASVLIVCIYKLRSALYVRSCADIERTSKAPLKHVGDDGTITVWGFQKVHPVKGICDTSPFVARVECYLKLLSLDYTKDVSADLSENPRSKLPFANLYGTMVDDSGRILRAIQEHGKLDPKAGLTADQIAQGHLVQRLLTGSLYWVRYSLNFLTEKGQNGAMEGIKKNVPGFIFPIIRAMVLNSQIANLMGQGFGRMPLEDIIEFGKEDFRALSAVLGDRTFILGTKEATIYDTDAYAFLSHFMYDSTGASMDWMEAVKEELPNLVKYTDRMRLLLFPDLKTKAN